VIIAAVCWQSSFTPAIGQPCFKPCRPVAATYLCHPLPSLSHQQPQTAAIGLWCSFCCHQAIGSQISHLEPVVPASDDGCICGLKLKHVLWAVEIAAWQKRPRAKKTAGIFGRALFPLAFVLFCS